MQPGSTGDATGESQPDEDTPQADEDPTAAAMFAEREWRGKEWTVNPSPLKRMSICRREDDMPGLVVDYDDQFPSPSPSSSESDICIRLSDVVPMTPFEASKI